MESGEKSMYTIMHKVTTTAILMSDIMLNNIAGFNINTWLHLC